MLKVTKEQCIKLGDAFNDISYEKTFPKLINVHNFQDLSKIEIRYLTLLLHNKYITDDYLAGIIQVDVKLITSFRNQGDQEADNYVTPRLLKLYKFIVEFNNGFWRIQELYKKGEMKRNLINVDKIKNDAEYKKFCEADFVISKL